MTQKFSRPDNMRRCMRIILCLIVIPTLLTAICLSAAASGWMRGDADGDGEITSLDVTAVQRVLAGIYEDGDGMMSKRGDVTGDSLTLLDATELQRWLAGFADVYHIGQNVGSDATEEPTSFVVFPTEDNQLPIITK